MLHYSLRISLCSGTDGQQMAKIDLEVTVFWKLLEVGINSLAQTDNMIQIRNYFHVNDLE